MTKITPNMSDTLKETEKRFYNRFYQKIYQGRIVKSSDLKFALKEYEKGFAFDVTFPTGINQNFDEFINYFEEADKLGHSFDSAIRLAKSKDIRESERKFANSKRNEEHGTAGVVYFEKEVHEISTATQVDASKWTQVGHFSEIPEEELISEYAMWKAKKRFLVFLRMELAPFETEDASENNGSNISESVLQNAETLDMAKTLSVPETISNLSADAYMELSKEIIKEVLTTKEQPSYPVLESKIKELEYFTITQLAEFLHCSKPTIHNYKKAGLPYYHIGRKVLFEKKKVLEFMKTIKSR